MTHTNAGADQLFVKLFQYYKRIDPFISEEALERLYDSIDDKKWLETVLSQYSEEAAAPERSSDLIRHRFNTAQVLIYMP
jgi:hypothetical protein